MKSSIIISNINYINVTPANGLTSTTLHVLLLLLFLSVSFPTLAHGQQSSDDDTWGQDSRVSPSMGVVVIVIVLLFFITGCIAIYIQQCSDTSSSVTTRVAGAVSRRGNVRGLDQSIIETFPTFVYSSVKELKIGKGALECAVCLNEFEEDETLRLLPKCDHVFHPDCIDAWLVGHTTCPVCRANLVPDTNSGDVTPESEEQVRSGDRPDIPSGQPVEFRVTVNERENSELATEFPKRKQRLPRAHSTGHSVVVQAGDDCERFTLRLPAEVRRQLLARTKLKRATSLVTLPRQTSSRRGYRYGGGEGSGSSRYGRLRSFLSRVGSFKTTAKVAADGDVTAECTGSKRGVTPLESLSPLPV